MDETGGQRASRTGLTGLGSVFRSRWFLRGLGTAALVGGYAAFGFGVAPDIVRQQAVAFVSKTYGRELQVGQVRLNPFLLQLEASDLRFPDRDGQAMLGLKRLFVDVEISSLWRRALVLRDVTLEGPEVRAVLRADGSFNLADLAPPAGKAADAGKSELPSLWIQSLGLTGGRVDYLDSTHQPQPLARSLAPVSLSLKDFRTTPEGGDFAFLARTSRAGSLDWRGRIALAPKLSSQGEFTMTGLHLPDLAGLLGDMLPFGVSTGAADLAGSYRVALGDGVELKLNVPKLALSGLGLRAPGADADWVQLPSLTVTDTAVALPARSISVGKVALAGLKATAWLDADGSINLQRLFVPSPAEPSPAVAKTATVTEGPPGQIATPWKVELSSLDLSNAAIDFEDRTQATAVRFAVAPLNLQLADASLDLSRPVKLAMQATVNDQAQFSLGGSLTPRPLAADLDVSVQQASLKLLQPYVDRFADLTLQDGMLAAKGKLVARPPAPRQATLIMSGEVTVNDFKSTDNSLKQDFVNFRSLELQRLRYEHEPSALSIDRMLITQPFARVSISREQVLNITSVLTPGPASAASVTPDKAASAAAETLPVRIRELRVSGGRMNFSDLGVQPNFTADVYAIGGTVTGMSSARDARAAVELKGQVDEFSPVVISGSIQPFAYDRYTDIGLQFRNITLPVLNPYSGRLAGYNIANGKLDTTLHYLVQDRRLNATHRIRIDQLEWGEATGSKDAATLPVKFATALLKDKEGVIELDVPVSGTLDDPELRIGPLVWKAVTNLVVKVVAAPFTLIASLSKDTQDAQYVDFAPGAQALDAATAARLAALARALVDKPGLRLDVPMGTAAELDRPALVERRYRQQVEAAAALAMGRKAGDQSPRPAFDALPPRQRLDILRALVQQQGGSRPPLPVAPAGSAPAPAGAEPAAILALEQQLRSAIVVPDAELDTLGRQRATAVQRALLEGTALQPERVFLSATRSVTRQGDKVRVELALK
jgi:uncharacterized protein involved in outer membrane biogenesis